MAGCHSIPDWWKKVPCHFNWKLDQNILIDFKGIANNLDSKLETRNEIEWTETACDMLLFRGYLEVSNFEGVQRNSQKAEEFFVEAEKEAMKVADDDERQAYIIIVNANRLWVLETIHEGNQNEDRRLRLLAKLEESWSRHRDELSQTRLQAFIDATAAFALTRLGPNKYKEAERRYQRALKTIKMKCSWYQSLGAVIGRQARLGWNNVSEPYDGIHDEIQCYEKAIELEPTNKSAQCDLAKVLLRLPDRVDEGKDIMANLDANTCELIIKKGRFYRRLRDNERALDVLRRGEELQHPRSELFLQISIVYRYLASDARDSNNKDEYRRLEMKYIDKCLELEPSFFLGKLSKAIALGKARRNEEAQAMFNGMIEEYKGSPYHLIEVQFRRAYSLFIVNRYQVNENIAKAYEDVIETALEITKNVDISACCQTAEFARQAKEYLQQYYEILDDGGIMAQNLRSRAAEIGLND
ncbi:interferon-induced protein with tetratricopeptide repeats 1-like [Apostichopus japonicus]|uniref:interferon-induced protein with tetratricopeptide repeats 1-like n=1 Tax=Stichopus japonicus TaxID=307972 RepID=UPI003AB4D8A5